MRAFVEPKLKLITLPLQTRPPIGVTGRAPRVGQKTTFFENQKYAVRNVAYGH